MGPPGPVPEKTRLVNHAAFIQNEIEMPIVSILLFHLIVVLSLSSCSKKGLTIKIGDQDVLALGSIDACNFVQNSQGLRVSWKSSTPVSFIISPGVPPQYDATIAKAAAIWNTYLKMELIRVVRDNGVTNPPGDDRFNVIYWMTDWPADQNMEQARTAIRWDISKLRDADIKINAKNFEFYAEGENGSAGKISLLSLLLHEMGHGAGLKHILDGSSIMQTHLASNTDRVTPTKTDIESLECEY